MDHAMIRYKVKREYLQQNLDLLRAAYEEIHASQPDDLQWVSYQLDDEISFVDIVSGSGDPGDLAKLPAFHRFRSTLNDRCDEPPAMIEITEIGAFR